jgi:glycerol-3-phosphate dehydrogenase
MDGKPQISPEETEYLCKVASDYFREPVTQQEIVWTYSGVRPLYDDGASAAQEATRDYVLAQEKSVSPAPLVNIFGGKITTYRILAEAMLDEIAALIGKKGNPWTADTYLPGGDFPVGGMGNEVQRLLEENPFLDKVYLSRLMRTYGTRTHLLLQGVQEKNQLGEHFGGQLFQKEVEYLIDHEWACSEEDILFRRTKQGIKFNPKQTAHLTKFVQQYVDTKLSKVTH